MSLEAWFSVAVVLAAFLTLMTTRIPPDVVLLGALAVLLVCDIVPVRDGLSGFASEATLAVGVLFVVVAGIRETGAIYLLSSRLFGRPRTVHDGLLRLMFPVASMSAFMNNTPLVAVLISVVNDWSERFSIPRSKLMIPLSYAAILGGTCTLVGTSTNLVVSGLLVSEANKPALGMFEITWVGLPAAIIGCTFVVLTSNWLLPDRRPAITQRDDPRQYAVEMVVETESPLVGKTIEQGGLRHLGGVYLAEIERDGDVLPAVSGQQRIAAGDRLVFVGILDSVVDLQKIRGLVPATDQVFKLDGPRAQRCLIEAVVSEHCPLVGKSIRDGRFRSVYQAAVIAVARGGQRLHQKIGDVVLRTGDTLLLEALPTFAEQQRNSRDFYLVSQVDDSHPPRHERAPIAVLTLLAMVIVVGIGWLSMLKAAMLAAGIMVATRCVSPRSARRSLDLQVLLAIAASFGLAAALERTGAAAQIANTAVGAVGGAPWPTLALIYLVTLIVTEIITNNAAAALMFPIAMAAAETLGVNYMPFVIAVMMAASAAFATPIGYQTNLMVFGPGGYRFSDYLRLGIPLDLLVAAITILLAPLIWPF